MALDSQRVKSIFLEAAGRAAEERAALLDEACAGHAELRRRLEQLLAAHDRPDSLPEAPPEPGRTQDSSPDGGRGTAGLGEGPGAVIGPYKLLQQLGEGGMGTVYLAEQSRPVRRMVALKIIKPGMDSRQVLARDEALTKLAAEDAVGADLVKLHFYAGFSVEEAADALAISRAQGYRHWTFARAWLRCALDDEAVGT